MKGATRVKKRPSHSANVFLIRDFALRQVFQKQAAAWLLFAVVCCQVAGALHSCHQHDDVRTPENCLICSWAQDLAVSADHEPLAGWDETSEFVRPRTLPVTVQFPYSLPFGPRAPPETRV
jgi:hypothetical protein